MKKAMIVAVAAIAAAALSDASVNAQGQGGPPVLARDFAPARQGVRLRVISPAFGPGGLIDDQYTPNGENMSPPLEWSKGPIGTRSYVVIAEDASVNQPEPIVHWVVYNIPSAVLRLPRDMPDDATLPNGALQGKTMRGSHGYAGPQPPAGQTHVYHFQVFAVNTRLDIDPANADRNTVLSAIKGRVVASGDHIGDYTGK